MDRRAWTSLYILGAIWGASYLFIKIGVRDLSPEMVAWVRIALAAAVLVPLAARAGALSAARASGVAWLTLVGAVQVAGPFILIGAAEQHIDSGLAGVLVASAPLFTALLAIRFDHEERSSGLRLVGILLGLVGVAVLLGVDLNGSGTELLGGFAVLLAGLGYAIGGFLVKRRLASVPPIGLAAWVMLASAVILLPAAILTLPDSMPGLGPVAAVSTLGVLGTGVAFAIFYRLMGSIGPARTFIVTYLAPGFAIAYGAVFLDESITASTLAGLALILGGSYLAAGRPAQSARAEPASDRTAPARALG
ncbi:MAG: DMT family transporter [Solirubrobacterales bacterium]